MTPGTQYTLHHPRWLRRPVSTWWWLHKWSYFKFILREISSLFVAWSVVLVILHIHALNRGPDAWAALQAWLARPLVLALSIVSFAFTLIHSVTWLSLAPRAMVIRLGDTRIPPAAVAAAHYAAWLAVSAGLLWLFMEG